MARLVFSSAVLQGGSMSRRKVFRKQIIERLANNANNNNAITLRNCVIRNNNTFTQGAGFEFYTNGTGTFNINVENCHIYNNTSRYAPAWVVASEGSSILNLNFINNLVERNKTVNQPINGWTGFKASAGGMMASFNTSKLNANIVNSNILISKRMVNG